MAVQSQLVLAWAKALTELVTVEKKNIVALTEIARDALRSEPQSAPSLATLLTTRVLQAPPPHKLPPLYLLDSISKLVGEPYKTLFVPGLPDAFMSAWQLGDGSLQRPLEKLLGTWTGVFPPSMLAVIQHRVAAPPAPMQPAAAAAPNGYGGGGYGYGPPAPAPQPRMAADPRVALMQPQPLKPQPVPGPGYGPPGGPYQQPPPVAYPGPAPQPLYPQQQAQPPQPLYQQPAAAPVSAPQLQPQQQQRQVSVPDLLSSLMDAGLLAPPGAQQTAAPPPGAPGGSDVQSTPPYAGAAAPPHAPAARATPEREQPATTRFTPDRLKEPNPSAVARLLRQTEATKSRFLDRKFLRRQQKAAGASARGSRLWYVDLDTWMASTVGATPGGATASAAGAAGGVSAGPRGPAPPPPPPQKHSVPVDDEQTHCALSGEQFEQFWDEEHQEWRYRDAKALDAEEAASYGLKEGAIVLVSALGQPALGVVQAAVEGGGGGVLAQLKAQQEIAADLAAAAAGGPAGAEAGESDAKPSLKHSLDDSAAGAEGGSPHEKRARLS